VPTQTVFLNGDQIPVSACDCPIFAMPKYIQWKYPVEYGEDKFLIMFGGMHLEKGLWNVLGDLLEGSGWTAPLTQAGVVSNGTADSFLKVPNLTKTQHRHQLTFLAIANVQLEEFNKCSDKPNSEEWRVTMRKSPHYFIGP
jgi:hypothetical protein